MCQRNVKFQVKETKDKGNPNTFSIGIGKCRVSEKLPWLRENFDKLWGHLHMGLG